MKAALIDANLLVLLIVGRCDREGIRTHKRLTKYDKEDFDLLVGMLEEYPFHVSIPSVLTEVSNLLSLGKRETQRGATLEFSAYVSNLMEIYRPSEEVIRCRAYGAFGLTDALIARVALTTDAGPGGLTIVTDDGPLYGFLAGQRVLARNFSHLRTPS